MKIGANLSCTERKRKDKTSDSNSEYDIYGLVTNTKTHQINNENSNYELITKSYCELLEKLPKQEIVEILLEIRIIRNIANNNNYGLTVKFLVHLVNEEPRILDLRTIYYLEELLRKTLAYREIDALTEKQRSERLWRTVDC